MPCRPVSENASESELPRAENLSRDAKLDYSTVVDGRGDALFTVLPTAALDIIIQVQNNFLS
jgi:hypothetical protein